MKKAFVLLLSLWSAGCTEDYTVEQEDPTKHVMGMSFDPSPSFEDHTEEAFAYFAKVMKQFNRDTGGENTRVLISQISSHAILFDGSPRAFMTRFSTKEKFAAALDKPQNSRVLGSMAETVEKLNSMHRQHPGMKSCFVCLSDLVDNASAAGDFDRLFIALKEYATHGGVVALHWVQTEAMANEWRSILKNAKVRHVVTTRTEAEPPVPRF